MDNKTCSNCCHFEAYYTKAYCCFMRTDCGNCTLKKQRVKKKENCENWKYRKIYIQRDKVKVVKKGLKKAFTDLDVIRLILEEEIEKETPTV